MDFDPNTFLPINPLTGIRPTLAEQGNSAPTWIGLNSPVSPCYNCGFYPIIQALPDLVWAHDSKGALIFSNNAYNDLVTQLVDKDAQLKKLNDLPAQLLPILDEKLGKELEEWPTTQAWIYRTTNLLPVLFETKISRLNSQRGDHLGTLYISKDITAPHQKERELVNRANRLRALINKLPGLFFQVSMDMQIVSWNEVLELIYEGTPDEIKSMHPLDFFKGSDKSRVNEAIQEVLATGRTTVEATIVSKNGKETPMVLTGLKIELEGQYYIVGTGVDISDRKVLESRLELSANVFTHANEGILVTSTDGIILEVNAAFSKITGYLRDEVVGCHTRILKSGVQPAAFYADMWKAIKEGGHWHGEIINRKKSGEAYSEMLTISAVLNSNGEPYQYVAIFSDITILKQQQAKLEAIAHYDALTGLPNRTLLIPKLQDAMHNALSTEKSVGVAYLDLDGFKAVNDAYGHAIGDQVLVQIAHKLKTSLKAEDTLTRIGGDEFVVILPDLPNWSSCEQIIQRLLTEASGELSIDGHSISLSASIGVTLYPQDLSIAENLLRNADQAMYQAKYTGKNKYALFNSQERATLQAIHADTQKINKGLQTDQFVLYYQPKVNYETREIIGFEALIRWAHPEQGILLPLEFLPVASKSELMHRIGTWVLSTVIAQQKAWISQGIHYPVSLNIAPDQLTNPTFVPDLKARLQENPTVNPNFIELEIVESAALADMGHASDVLRVCAELGVTASLDDFGTGYSSLTFLRRLPVATIKIDQSFVLGMLSNKDDKAIVVSTINLAKAFNRKLVAEGVESATQAETLVTLGCPIIQGYLISQPLPADEIPGWIENWTENNKNPASHCV